MGVPPKFFDGFDDQTARRIQRMLKWFEATHEAVWKPPNDPGARPYGQAISFRWGKLDGILNAGGTATVSLWQKTGGGWDGWDEDSGENWTGVHAPFIMASGSFDLGTKVLAAIINGRKVIVGHACPMEEE